MGLEAKVDVLGNEGSEGGETAAEGIKNFEKCIESVGCVVNAVLAL